MKKSILIIPKIVAMLIAIMSFGQVPSQQESFNGIYTGIVLGELHIMQLTNNNGTVTGTVYKDEPDPIVATLYGKTNGINRMSGVQEALFILIEFVAIEHNNTITLEIVGHPWVDLYSRDELTSQFKKVMR
ncbi:hypothetical protein [Flavitalea sp.]|nr:hypothetical protein [Flavitalea sp.]